MELQHHRHYQRQRVIPSSLLLLSLVLVLSFPETAEAYKNYTVGDSLGWYDNLEKPTLNYQKWVSAKIFNLGDFLIFNTDTNHSVIQTYNFNTYKRCDYDNALDNDTSQWSAGDPSAITPTPVTVPVPLLKVGMTYFFSGDYDGEQCKNGQHFKINVTFGHGLPPSLKDPADESPGPASPPSNGADDESAPETLVPSNFNDPRGTPSDDMDASNSASLLPLLRQFGWQFNRIVILSWGSIFILI